MKKQVLLVHSAGSQEMHQGSSDLVAYLQKELGDEYNLLYPKMPNPESPKYKLWKDRLENELAMLEGEVILIGHSLGGSVLMKYLSEYACQLSISGLYLIAAPFWGKDEDWQIKEFILLDHFSSRLPQISQIFLYHSRNDGIVPFAHFEHYMESFPQATIRVFDGDEHVFNDGLPKLVSDIKYL